MELSPLLQALIEQAPMVVVLLYAIKTLYMDAKSERSQMIAAITLLAGKIDILVSVIVANPDMIDEIRRIYDDTNNPKS